MSGVKKMITIKCSTEKCKEEEKAVNTTHASHVKNSPITSLNFCGHLPATFLNLTGMYLVAYFLIFKYFSTQ